MLSVTPGLVHWRVYLYWMVSEVVEARSLVMRILTMLKRNTKLICRKKSRMSTFSLTCKHLTASLPEKYEIPGKAGALRFIYIHREE